MDDDYHIECPHCGHEGHADDYLGDESFMVCPECSESFDATDFY